MQRAPPRPGHVGVERLAGQLVAEAGRAGRALVHQPALEQLAEPGVAGERRHLLGGEGLARDGGDLGRRAPVRRQLGRGHEHRVAHGVRQAVRRVAAPDRRGQLLGEERDPLRARVDRGRERRVGRGAERLREQGRRLLLRERAEHELLERARAAQVVAQPAEAVARAAGRPTGRRRARGAAARRAAPRARRAPRGSPRRTTAGRRAARRRARRRPGGRSPRGAPRTASDGRPPWPARPARGAAWRAARAAARRRPARPAAPGAGSGARPRAARTAASRPASPRRAARAARRPRRPRRPAASCRRPPRPRAGRARPTRRGHGRAAPAGGPVRRGGRRGARSWRKPTYGMPRREIRQSGRCARAGARRSFDAPREQGRPSARRRLPECSSTSSPVATASPTATTCRPRRPARRPSATRPIPASAGSAATSSRSRTAGSALLHLRGDSPEAIRAHAEAFGLTADEVVPVADTVVVRPDPVAAEA